MISPDRPTKELSRDASLLEAFSQKREEILFLARVWMGEIKNPSLRIPRDQPTGKLLQAAQRHEAAGRVLVVIGGQASLPWLRLDFGVVQQLGPCRQRVVVVPLLFEQSDPVGRFIPQREPRAERHFAGEDVIDIASPVPVGEL